MVTVDVTPVVGTAAVLVNALVDTFAGTSHLGLGSDSHLGRSDRDAWWGTIRAHLAAARDEGGLAVTHTAVAGTAGAAGASLTTAGSTGLRAAHFTTAEGISDI